MSKKECKRVPSYAIRHLIQSLKEKGRTCRKGAEQRIDREILICDPEEEYVRRLAEALLLKKEVTAGVRICSSPEMVQELLKIGLINVLYYAKQERDDIGIRIASMVKRMGDLDYIPPMKVWTDLRAVHTEEWKTLFERLISQSVYSVIILDIGNGMEDVFQMLRLCDQILMPCAEDVYAMAKIAQYQHMLKVLRYQELESRTMYINMGKNMRQTVKETVELLKESTEKRFFYAEGRTTS